MRKKEAGIALIIAMALFLLAGCAPITPPSPTASPQAPIADAPELSPQAGEGETERREVALYFQMRGENMLVRETRTVRVPMDTQLEEVLIGALIEGPSPQLLGLTGLFNAGTKVVSVSKSGTLLTVTLSREFLATPADAPATWNNDPAWRSEVLLRRRLALSSIVNTITEATDYTAVQLLVQQGKDDAAGQRISRSEIYESAAAGSILTPVSREEYTILTHYNTAYAILNSWRSKDFIRLYRFITAGPTEAAFQQEIVAYDRSLTSFSLTPGIVSSDGKTAVISALLEYTDVNGVMLIENYPVHLVCVDGLWKMRYETLIRLMEATES